MSLERSIPTKYIMSIDTENKSSSIYALLPQPTNIDKENELAIELGNFIQSKEILNENYKHSIEKFMKIFKRRNK